jgi:hypothetical protein
MSTGVQTAVGQIVWHTLMTSDVEQAKSFYGELLGWEYELFMPGEHEVPVIRQNGQQHGGIRPVEGGAPPHWFGYVQVHDLVATTGRVESAGGRTLVPATAIPDAGTFAVFADPQGAVIAAFIPAGEMPAPAGTFVWDELMTSDIDAARRFYSDVFGWTAVERDMGTGPYTIFNRAEDSMAAGAMQQPAEDPGPPRWMTYAATDDVDATVARARKLGATAFVEGMDIPTVGRIAVIADPQGAVIGLFQATE